MMIHNYRGEEDPTKVVVLLAACPIRGESNSTRAWC